MSTEEAVSALSTWSRTVDAQLDGLLQREEDIRRLYRDLERRFEHRPPTDTPEMVQAVQALHQRMMVVEESDAWRLLPDLASKVAALEQFTLAISKQAAESARPAPVPWWVWWVMAGVFTWGLAGYF